MQLVLTVEKCSFNQDLNDESLKNDGGAGDQGGEGLNKNEGLEKISKTSKL